jgi:hypothetical protein
MTGPHRDRQHRIAESITATGNALSSGLEGRQIRVTWAVASWDSKAKATSSALCSFGRSKEELIQRPDDACRLRVSTARGARLPVRLACFAATRTRVSAEVARASNRQHHR